jgi:hypothetical protein
MSFKSTVIALALTAFGTAAAFAQEPGDLFFYKVNSGGVEFIQRAHVLPIPLPPPAPVQGLKAVAPGAIPTNLIVEAALDWQVRHGYLTDADLQNVTPVVTVSSSGVTMTIHTPGGGNITIQVGPGPIYSTDFAHRLMSIIVVRPIQNLNVNPNF